MKKAPAKKTALKKKSPVKIVVKSSGGKKPVKTVAKVAVATKPISKTLIPLAVKSVPTVKTPPAPKKETTAASKSKTASSKVAETQAPEVLIKRPAKLFFIEVKPGAERVIKRGDKSLTTPASMDIQSRRKDTAAEETTEELGERIERELQHQSFFKRSTLKPQMCTKCGVSVVVPRFTIDRELGYCDGCADILRLGATKEARRMEFNPSVKKESDDIVPPDEAAVALEAAEGDEETVPDID